MESNSFWLVDIKDHSLVVSLASKDPGFHLSAFGPEIAFEANPESLTTAIDESLSAAAEAAKLSPKEEPDSIALIISPFWVGLDGRILPDRAKLINNIFRKLELKPMGFIAFDDAIVEEANLSDGFPASFVLVNIHPQGFDVSLTYLGKVIERLRKPLADDFSPQILESSLLEFKSDSTLPPAIILVGQVTPEIVEEVKLFPWIGKKNIETFLHFPDIKSYTQGELMAIYLRAITSQFSSGTSPPDIPEEEVEELAKPEPVAPPDIKLDEVSPEDLGFSVADNFSVPELPPEEPSPEEVIPPPPKKVPRLPKLTIPKFSLPRIPALGLNLILLPLALLPLLILIPFYFSTATITLFLNPYEFTKTLNVTFDPQATEADLSKNIFPIDRQDYEQTFSASIAATGQKTIGDKAKGEITVYNKQDKVQNLPKGLILSDDQSHKFELVNAVQITASTSDLQNGVITLGRTKVLISAAEIGPEYNLTKDTLLHFKDFADSLMVARVDETLTGGSKRQIKAVAAADRLNLEKKLADTVTESLDSRLSQEITDRPGIIKEITQIKKGRVDYNREVGEEADELSGTVVATVSLYFFEDQKKQQIINQLFSDNPEFTKSAINPDSFKFEVTNVKNTGSRPSGTVTVAGSALPTLNTPALVKQFSGKSQKKATDYIQKNVPRVYKYQINTNFSFLNSINPLPFRSRNITIDIK